MGTLSHVLEAEGLATVGLSLIRGQTERLRPPRALYCEFPLGRPLGRPLDPSFQRRVLDAAFSLLDRRAGPVLEDFPETIEDDTDSDQLLCAVPPRHDPTLPAAVDEAIGLRAAYERQLASTGRTTMGRLLTVETLPAAVASFVRVAAGAPLEEVGLGATATEAALDIRAYYEEASLTLADHVPAARETQAWFFSHTATGSVLTQAQLALKRAGEDADTWSYLAPLFLDG